MASKDLIKGLGNAVLGGVTGGLGSVAGGLVTNALGSMFGLDSSKKQWELEQKRMEQQFEYNKAMAKYNHMLGLQMYEATGYKSQVRQMQEAGLNPALMYGSAGSTGQATQGTGAGVQQGQTQAVAMGLNMQRMALDNRLAEAQIKKMEVETKHEEKKAQNTDSLTAINNVIKAIKDVEKDASEKNLELLDITIKEHKSNLKVLTETEQARIGKTLEDCQRAMWEQIGARLDKEMKEQERAIITEKAKRYKEYLQKEITLLDEQGKSQMVNRRFMDAKISEILYMIGSDGKEGLRDKQFKLEERKQDFEQYEKYDFEKTITYIETAIEAIKAVGDIIPAKKGLQLAVDGIDRLLNKK